jgi:hypothetical protein
MNHSYDVDPWHIERVTSESTINSKFMKLFKKHAQRDDNLPIYVGLTGYIELSEDMAHDKKVWTEDKWGRMVGVWGRMLFFQRHTKNDMLMFGSLKAATFSDCVTSDMVNRWIENIQSPNMDDWLKEYLDDHERGHLF